MNVFIREARVTDAESITRVLNPIIEARANSVFTEPFSVDAEREFIVQFRDATTLETESAALVDYLSWVTTNFLEEDCFYVWND